MNLQRLWCLLVIIAFSMPVFAATPYQIDSLDDFNNVVDPNWVEKVKVEYGSYVEQVLVGAPNEVNEGAGSMKFDFPSYVTGERNDEVKRTFSPALDWDSNWKDLAITLWVWTSDPYETRRTTTNTPGGIKLNRLKEIFLHDGSGQRGHFPPGPLLVLKDTGWNKVIAPLRNFAWQEDDGELALPIDPNEVDWNDINDIVLWARTEHPSDHNAIYIDDIQLEWAPDPCSRPYQLASCDDINDELWDELRYGSNAIMFQSPPGDPNFREGTGSMMLDYGASLTVATPSLAFIPALDFTDGNDDWAFTVWVWTDLVGESHLYHMILHDVGDHLGRYRVPTLATYGWNKITARMDEFLWQDALETLDMPTHTSDEVNLDAILFMEMWTRNLPTSPPRRGNPIYMDDFRIEPAVEALSEAVVYNADYASVPLTIDGNAIDWAGLVDSDIIDFDLQAVPEPNGDLHVQYRLAWDPNYLYILVEEQTGDTETTEAASQADFIGFEMTSLYDGLSLWFDFTNNRLPEVEMHISFWLHLGLSSTGQTDLISAWTNADWDEHQPDAVTNASLATSGTRPSRVIEARVKWSDLDGHLDSWWQPAGGIEAAVQPGYIFGCDPRLNDREDLLSREWTDEHCMAWLTGWAWDDFRLDDFLPTGRDTYSIDIRLCPPIGDLDGDCDVDFADYALFTAEWLDSGCGACGGADLTGDTNVDSYDLSEFTDNWLIGF